MYSSKDSSKNYKGQPRRHLALPSLYISEHKLTIDTRKNLENSEFESDYSDEQSHKLVKYID